MKLSVFYDHILQASEQSGKTLEELLSEVRRAGIEAVEIRLACLLKHEETLSLLKQAGLAISCIYEFYEMDSRDEAEKTREHIETARRVQTDRILVVPGFFSEEESKKIPGILQSYEKTAEFMENNIKAKRMAEGLRHIVRLGTEAGVTVTVEDFDDKRSPLAFANGILWFLNIVPGLRYTLDMGNFIFYGEDVLEVWERLQDKISHVHCKDRGAGFSSVAAGEGSIPIAELIGRLKARGYDGYLAIEHFDAPDQEECIKRSAEFLKQMVRNRSVCAPCLSAGGAIGICSPSHIAKREDYKTILEGICRMGYRVREADNLYQDTYGYLAAPQERAADFNQLIDDSEVELVLFGGGNGSIELLPYIDFEKIRKHPKRICSYSDGTTILNVVWAQTGLETYYGQTPGIFPNPSSYDQEHFKRHLVEGNVKAHFANSIWQVQTVGKAEGLLIGGYLENFAMLLGSRYFPLDLNEKYILFLEDYEQFNGVDSVSAMLSYIEQSDLIHSVAGLIFGHYSSKPCPMLLDRLKRFGEQHCVPTVYCDDFGHGVNHAIIPIGRRAVLDTKRSTLFYQK